MDRRFNEHGFLQIHRHIEQAVLVISFLTMKTLKRTSFDFRRWWWPIQIVQFRMSWNYSIQHYCLMAQPLLILLTLTKTLSEAESAAICDEQLTRKKYWITTRNPAVLILSLFLVIYFMLTTNKYVTIFTHLCQKKEYFKSKC